MKRKIIKQGLGGYTIYLPKKWVDRFNLDKGSGVEIEEAGDDLIISADGKKTLSETNLGLTHLSESSIRTLITNAYRKGFDKILVDFYSENQFKILADIVNKRLIGFDIQRNEKNRCIIESVTEPNADQFDDIMLKFLFNIRLLFGSVKKRINKEDQFEDVELIEERIMKYDNFCKRIISKKSIRNKNSELLWTFLTLLNHGQREIYHLNKILKDGSLDKQNGELFKSSSEIFELIFLCYTKKDIKLIGKIHDLEKKIIYDLGYGILSGNNSSPITYHLLISIREFYQANSPLTGLLV
ncbi:AbrB/MazE/SpoVT family DNA-binding domain-containing protein [Candidatus Woesearchaeota archaeon]|nr:AbrB/MazE/SpoVT family DNA-binding domain-containing protein [Candidatus Woesearchaeota archaeon]MCF7900909.1 AbrB/MazE/SpoVT family DNA-binding domain-containing protein [Candidatus Woesearchaeota archaeon]MCF8013042.1 AbrB/MazE/SpoVT family DNA-binding domain-containing protein [Candidatus Woesearchaeota archaeon]